jgi:hypothetical protein
VGFVDIDWIELAQDRGSGRAVVTAVMNRRGSIKCGEFVDWLKVGYVFKKDCAT